MKKERTLRALRVIGITLMGVMIVFRQDIFPKMPEYLKDFLGGAGVGITIVASLYVKRRVI